MPRLKVRSGLFGSPIRGTARCRRSARVHPALAIFVGIGSICWAAIHAAISVLAYIDAPMLAAASSGG